MLLLIDFNIPFKLLLSFCFFNLSVILIFNVTLIVFFLNSILIIKLFENFILLNHHIIVIFLMSLILHLSLYLLKSLLIKKLLVLLLLLPNLPFFLDFNLLMSRSHMFDHSTPLIELPFLILRVVVATLTLIVVHFFILKI